MNRLIFSLVALCLSALAGPAYAQNYGQAIPVTGPDAYAASIALSISRERMAPIRQVFQQLLGSEVLDPTSETAVVTYERYLEGMTIDQFSELDDAALNNTIRRIYYLHSFNGRYLFTRFDFIRDSRGWNLTGISFGSSWQLVATQSSPGWVVQ